MIHYFNVIIIFSWMQTNTLGGVVDSDVEFFIHSNKFGALKVEHSTQDNIIFQEDTRIAILIHGWTESKATPWYGNLTNAYLRKKNPQYDVIQVDWSRPASQNYLYSVLDTPKVGEIIARFIADLIYYHFIDINRIHVVGHSLGGQVAGYVGKSMPDFATGMKLKRITALDPAGPLFQGLLMLTGDSLRKTDAELVVVIHTDGGVYGVLNPIGKIDIFPNGGRSLQPGCSRTDTKFCSHHKSYWYFAEAVDTGMIATKCDNWSMYSSGNCHNNHKIDIGGELNTTDEGLYFLTTNAMPPYAKNT